MDPMSAVAMRALGRALADASIDVIREVPGPFLRKLLGELLEVAVIVSDELDRRDGI